MRFYNLYSGTGSFQADINFQHLTNNLGKVRIKSFSIEVDNPITVDDSLGITRVNGPVPFPLSDSMEENINELTAISRISFYLTILTANTQVWINVEVERPDDDE